MSRSDDYVQALEAVAEAARDVVRFRSGDIWVSGEIMEATSHQSMHLLADALARLAAAKPAEDWRDGWDEVRDRVLHENAWGNDFTNATLEIVDELRGLVDPKPAEDAPTCCIYHGTGGDSRHECGGDDAPQEQEPTDVIAAARTAVSECGLNGSLDALEAALRASKPAAVGEARELIEDALVFITKQGGWGGPMTPMRHGKGLTARLRDWLTAEREKGGQP